MFSGTLHFTKILTESSKERLRKIKIRYNSNSISFSCLHLGGVLLLTLALAQMEIKPGHPSTNLATMLRFVEQAKAQSADMIIFPEMCLPGYLLGDAWEQEAFLRDCEDCGKALLPYSEDLIIVFGNVAIDWSKRGNDGRVRKYNACFVAYEGKFWGSENFPYPFRIKSLLPNYREFDDTRHFFSLPKLALEQGVKPEELLTPVTLPWKGQELCLGCLLCEDGWSDDYGFNPAEVLSQSGSLDLLLNLSSSPYTLGKNQKRHRVFAAQAKKLGLPLVYVNNVGLQNNGKTIYTFDGSSTLYSPKGEILLEASPFIETLLLSTQSAQSDLADSSSTAFLFQALTYGIHQFMSGLGLNKVVVGASGGIDSAVNAALYSHVLGPDNVLLINMPSRYNSQTTQNLAEKLAKNLGCFYSVMPIEMSFQHTYAQMTETPLHKQEETHYLTLSPLAMENIQARDRSSRILAGAAASFGGVFTCNANKSEMTVGYSTLYGDLGGFLGATADLWKHQVYDIARYINAEVYQREIIPEESITIVPSAELSFDQNVDEGKGDPIKYDYHDYLFRAFVERWNRATPEDILNWYSQDCLEEQLGCATGLVRKYFPTPNSFIQDLERWWKLYTGMAVAKRIQAPPVLAVSRRAFGFDHRESQMGPYWTTAYLKLKEKILQGGSNHV